MSGINIVVLKGNLTRDPEARETKNGTPVAKFSIAVNRKFRTVAGEDREDVAFVDIETYSGQATSCTEYLRKGSEVLVQGRLKQDTWERKDGTKASKLLVRADAVQFLRRTKLDDKYNSEKPLPQIPE